MWVRPSRRRGRSVAAGVLEELDGLGELSTGWAIGEILLVLLAPAGSSGSALWRWLHYTARALGKPKLA